MLYPHAKFGGDVPQHGGERGKMGVFRLFLPAGKPPVLKLLRCPILRFFAPHWRHDSLDSWIDVKFGTTEVPSAGPNFTLLGEYLGFPVQKKHENLPKNFQSFSCYLLGEVKMSFACSHTVKINVTHASQKSQLKVEYEIYLIYYLSPPRPAKSS